MTSLRLINDHPLIDGLLSDWETALGNSYMRYRNHVYRVFNYALFFDGYQPKHTEAIAVAAVFHDIGIWSANTFDYLAPSIDELHEYISSQSPGVDFEQVAQMIRLHHKVTPIKDPEAKLAEHFRQADMVDVSKGIIRFGMSSHNFQLVRDTFPYYGFHGMLARMTLAHTLRHPFRPLPMFKW